LVAFSEDHCIHRRGLGKDNREYGMVNNHGKIANGQEICRRDPL
jgi:hypothetical protein